MINYRPQTHAELLTGQLSIGDPLSILSLSLDTLIVSIPCSVLALFIAARPSSSAAAFCL